MQVGMMVRARLAKVEVVVLKRQSVQEFYYPNYLQGFDLVLMVLRLWDCHYPQELFAREWKLVVEWGKVEPQQE